MLGCNYCGTDISFHEMHNMVENSDTGAVYCSEACADFDEEDN